MSPEGLFIEDGTDAGATDPQSTPEPASAGTDGAQITPLTDPIGQPTQSDTQPPDAGTNPLGSSAAPAEGGEIPPTAEAPPELQAPWEPVPLPDNMQPELALGAARYWQSKHDALKTSTESSMAEFKRTEHIVGELLQDPEAYAYLEDRWKQQQQQHNGQAPQQASVSESVNPLIAPPEDLFSDEGDQWLRDNYKAMAAQNAQLANKVAGLQQGFQNSVQQSQDQADAREATLTIQNTMFWPQEKAATFQQILRTKGMGYHETWQDMAVAWDASQRPTAAAVRQQQAATDAQNRQNGRTPQTATAAGGVTPVTQVQVDGLFAPAGASDAIDPFEI